MSTTLFLVLMVIITALFFDFTNGFHDSAKAILWNPMTWLFGLPSSSSHALFGGLIGAVLITAGYQDAGTGPQFWVIASAGLAIGLGTYSGGWRIMRTMGRGIVDIRSPPGFAAETTSAAAILASSQMGFGLSTTQVCSGSIYAISKRSPVSSGNVNDSPDVTINPEKATVSV